MLVTGVLAPAAVMAQSEAGLQLPHGREGSGTSWMPDSMPVFAHHFMAGDWMLMLHYAATVGYDDQWSDRGSRRFLSTNWIMGMASHPLLGGEITFRSMLSAEPATAGGHLQVPLLLQSGETYGGQPLHDRQHPHDLFMEVAAIYRHALWDGVGIELYGAPSGEPALGPTAFMHRLTASAMWSTPILDGGNLALTGVWGRKINPAVSSDSLLAEAQIDLDGRNVPFLRLEYVQKLGHDLVLPGDPEAKYDVFQGVFGYARRLPQLGPVVPILGAAIDVGLIPDAIQPAYGTRLPVGAFVFVGVQPPKMQMGHHHMEGM